MKCTFSKYDRFMMVFFKTLIIYGALFTQATFLFKGACLLKTSKNIFSEGAYSSTVSAESVFRKSRLELFSLKYLQFLCDISLTFAFEKCNLVTDKTSFWKSESPVKTVSILKKLFRLFVKILFIQQKLFGFLQQVGS